MLTRLIDYLANQPMEKGLKNSIQSKLGNALARINNSQMAPARGMLDAAINEAEAQRNKRLTGEQATRINDAIRRILNALPAPPNK